MNGIGILVRDLDAELLRHDAHQPRSDMRRERPATEVPSAPGDPDRTPYLLNSHYHLDGVETI